MGSFGTQGQVTPKSVVRFGPNSNSSEIYACPDYLQTHKDPMKSRKDMLWTRSNMVFFGTQWHVHLSRQSQ